MAMDDIDTLSTARHNQNHIVIKEPRVQLLEYRDQ